MNTKSKVRNAVLVGIVGSVFALPLSAVEIVTQDDLVKGVIKKEQLVRLADNAVFLLDTSSSMNGKLEGTETPMIQAVTNELKRRNSYFPDIGINMGLYTYTTWKDNSPVQPYDREKIAAALDTIPERVAARRRSSMGSKSSRSHQAADGQDGRVPVLRR